MDTPTETRDQIIMAALPHVMFDGWTFKSLEQGAASLGLPKGSAERAFPRGLVSSVEWFNRLADRLFQADFAALVASEGERPVHQRVGVAVRLRLERWSPHKDAIRRALALYAQPASCGLAPKAAWQTADLLWRAAGDRSTDFNWYTKRATLVAVWSATLFYWLDDTSPDNAATWDFLNRQLSGVATAIKTRKRLTDQLKDIPNPLMRLLAMPQASTLRRAGRRPAF